MSMTLNMSMTLSPPSLSLHPSLSHASPHHCPVAFLRRRHHHHRRRRLSVAATISKDTATGTSSPLAEVSSSGERLCFVTVDLANWPDLVANFVRPGQHLQISIPPTLVNLRPVAQKSEFEFLVKCVPGKMTGVICTLKKGESVELFGIYLSQISDIEQLSPPEGYPTAWLFTTRNGISPVRIETRYSADERSDVRIYYEAENLQRMLHPHDESIKIWEDSGLKVTKVLSNPPADWTGATDHVQDVYAKDNPIVDPRGRAEFATLIGNQDMIKEAKAILLEHGYSPENILLPQ